MTAEEDGLATEVTGIPLDHVVQQPSYSMPTIGSLLPSYKNADVELILSVFSKAAFQNIQDLPTTLRSQAVLRNKLARQELAQLVGPGCSMSGVKAWSKPKTLFSNYSYMPDEYEAARQQDNVDRAVSHEAQTRISGKSFVVACNSNGARVPWLDSFVQGATYPYLSSPYEAQEVHKMQEDWERRLMELSGPFVPACTGRHLAECPTKACQRSMQQSVIRIIHDDWPGAEVELFENSEECWVVKVSLASIDSPRGLTAYLGVLLRGDARVRAYRLSKVVEHWNITPGDGNVYYTLRPPWVVCSLTATFFALHPDQRSYRTAVVFKEALRAEKSSS